MDLRIPVLDRQGESFCLLVASLFSKGGFTSCLLLQISFVSGHGSRDAEEQEVRGTKNQKILGHTWKELAEGCSELGLVEVAVMRSKPRVLEEVNKRRLEQNPSVAYLNQIELYYPYVWSTYEEHTDA